MFDENAFFEKKKTQPKEVRQLSFQITCDHDITFVLFVEIKYDSLDYIFMDIFMFEIIINVQIMHAQRMFESLKKVFHTSWQQIAHIETTYQKT